jgi:hypothetical protein
MNIPLNGRIAIIDDVYEQAEPLIRILSKNQMPYTFYKGVDSRYLPEENERINDIRLLFLDINLIDDTAVPNEKQMRSALVYSLERVLSANNFPYSIIYWSRHEEEHKALIEDIFENELNDRKPIIYKGFVKSDFFPNFSTEEVENTIDIISEIEKIILEQEAYSLLLEWENLIHISTDLTLQELFSSYHKFEDWSNNANYIVCKLAKAYLEKHLANASSDEVVNASLQTLTVLFRDYLESSLRNRETNSQPTFAYDKANIEADIKKISSKLNLTRHVSDIKEPGCVLLYATISEINLDKIIDFYKLKQESKDSLLKLDPNIEEKNLDKQSTKAAFKARNQISEEIGKNGLNISIVVTPVCDYAQNNNVYDRIVQGLLIPKSESNYIINNDALFIVPFDIIHDDQEFRLVLDFRYFVTTDLTLENVSGLFRIRQELLSEIQSKLSRHINRQGILLIDEK